MATPTSWKPHRELRTTKECDLWTIDLIDAKLYAAEPDLMTTKWFDYRHLHPMQATDYFAQVYRAVYREYSRRNRDVDEPTNGISNDILRAKPAVLTGLWKARQHADQGCIPYDIYIRAAFKWSNDAIWQRLPRPTQLYSKPCLEFIHQRWSMYQEVSLPLPRSETYSSEFYAEREHQIKFYIWVAQIVSQKRSAAFALYSLIYDYKIMDRKVAANYFSEKLLSDAENLR